MGEKMSPFWRLRMAAKSRVPIGGHAARFAYALFQRAFGAFIPLSARFAGEPCLPHGAYGIFISGGARIGTDVVIFQHVTIGSNTLLDSKNFGAPVIGDRVFIGAGAKIIGAVHIGDGARIAAGAVVGRDVPPNATVFPDGKIVPSERPRDNRYFSLRKGMDGWAYFRGGKWIRSDEPLARQPGTCRR